VTIEELYHARLAKDEGLPMLIFNFFVLPRVWQSYLMVQVARNKFRSGLGIS
jgi:hypothetical protein